MTSLWIAIAVLTLAVLALLLTPLLRRQAAAPTRIGYDVAVYRDQLSELDRDLERGLLNSAQADQARLEIQRRMLAAEAADKAEQPQENARRQETGRWLRMIASVVILLGIPGGGLYVYGRLGSPRLPAQPYEARLNSPEFKLAGMIDKLAAELKKNPSPRGYVLLGNAQRNLRRYDDAAQSYRQAVQLGDGDAETLATLGETIVLANGGGVMPEARQAFQQALMADPHDPRSRYYLGLAKAQIGKAADAIAIWRDLVNDAPADAPWLPMVKSRIDGLAKEAKLDPATIKPQAPSTEGVPAAPKMATATPQNQEAMIHSMVQRLADRLQKNPNDLQGWLRLARAYRVLGDLDKATDAAKHAVELAPKSTEPLLALGDVQLARAKGDELPADFVATMRTVLGMDANNGEALYYVGAAEARAGHIDVTRQMWNKLLQQFPADSPDHADLQKQIDALPKK